MKKWIVALLVGVALIVPTLARAHEGHVHKALGTVSRIDGDHVTVKKTDGKTLVIMLDKQTTVTRGKDKLDATALKMGERLSVDYMEDKGMMMAKAIKLATAAAKK
jgi:hypothetical protein